MTHQEFDKRLEELLIAKLKRAYFNGSTDVLARKNGVIPNDTKLGEVMIGQLAGEAKQAIRELFEEYRTTITGKEGGDDR